MLHVLGRRCREPIEEAVDVVVVAVRPVDKNGARAQKQRRLALGALLRIGQRVGLPLLGAHVPAPRLMSHRDTKRSVSPLSGVLKLHVLFG